MRFFFDNQISYRLAEAIDRLADVDGDQVVALRAKFPQDATDLTWIPQLASERDWIIVSGDCKIRDKPAERKIFFEAKLTTFFLAKGWINAELWEQASLLIRWWPKLREQATLVEAGTVIEIPFRKTGRFKLLSP